MRNSKFSGLCYCFNLKKMLRYGTDFLSEVDSMDKSNKNPSAFAFNMFGLIQLSVHLMQFY